MDTSLMPQLRTIRVEAVADGVYAAISIPGQGSVGNAGIIDLGDETLIFDTLKTPAAAIELCQAAEKLTGRSATWIVNSHWHDDHVAGNQVFLPEARAIIATERTRELMATQLVAEYAEDAAKLPDFLVSLQAQLAGETDARQREHLALRLAENRLLAEEVSEIKVTLPTLTFDGRLTLRGALRTVELLCYGGGHTESDLFLYLPAEQTAFLGDLAFLNCHPWLSDGDPDEWTHILDRVEKAPLQVVVPGHGPVSDYTTIRLTRQYIIEAQAQARSLVASADTSEERLSALPAPDPFDGWSWPHFHARNLRFLVGRAAMTSSAQTA